MERIAVLFPASVLPYKTSRRIPKIKEKVVQTHAQHVGEIVWASNALHSQLFDLFWTLVSKPNHLLDYNIWHCIQSDSTQREMLEGVAKAVLPAKSAMLKRIQWIIDSAGKLSRYRNDAVHTPITFIFRKGKLTLHPDYLSGRRPALERLAQKTTEQRWPGLRGDLIALSEFAFAVSVALNHPGKTGPLPRRPRLRSVPSSPRKSRKKDHRSARRASKPPP